MMTVTGAREYGIERIGQKKEVDISYKNLHWAVEVFVGIVLYCVRFFVCIMSPLFFLQVEEKYSRIFREPATQSPTNQHFAYYLIKRGDVVRIEWRRSLPEQSYIEIYTIELATC